MSKVSILNCETGESEIREETTEEAAQRQATHLEHGWRELRLRRNHLLASSDWTVMTDTPANTAAWKTYRQQLRDITEGLTDPYEANWPTPPK